jgi:hypothetical protein
MLKSLGKLRNLRTRSVASISGALIIGAIALPSVASTLPGGFNPGDLLGGELGGIGDIEGQIDQFLNPIQSYISQLEQIQQQVSQIVDRIVGAASGAVSKAIQDALGALNLPDPQELFDKVLGKIEQGETEKNPIHGVSPIIYQDNQTATVAAKVYAQTNFSKQAQENLKTELTQLNQQITTATQTVSGSNQLAQTSSQAAQQAQQKAQQAQSRVSTQDAIKDLNQITASVSSQLGSQSGQLANLNSLQATTLQVAGAQANKLAQINLGVAATVQQLADVNDQMRGQQQAEVIERNALTDRVIQANSSGFNLLR